MGLTMKEKKALTTELARQYRRSNHTGKTAILNEFVLTTGYNRKYAIHLLSNWGKKTIRIINGKMVNVVIGKAKKRKRTGHRIYGVDVQEAVKQLWKFFDYMCGKRLVVLIRMNIEILMYQPEFDISETVKQQLISISAATVDRMLVNERNKHTIKSRSRTRPSTLLKHQIPIRTFSQWDERIPGFFELDTVGHDGGIAQGEYCFTFTATDVSSGWVELRALPNRAQTWVKASVEEIDNDLPFQLKGIDSDNGGEFINKELHSYCVKNNIEFTRGRAYRKNDNCFVEQKNDMAVRKTVGYLRYDTPKEYEALQEVYRHLCPLINFFYPSAQLIKKVRIGSKVKKIYDDPKTPYQRLLESDQIDAKVKRRLKAMARRLHIVEQKRLVDEAIDKLMKEYEKKSHRTSPR